MTRMVSFTRRGVLAGLLAAGTAGAEALNVSLRPKLRPSAEFQKTDLPTAAQIIEKARLEGDVHYALLDAQTGEVLEASGDKAPSVPASVTKTITALYALNALGADHQFETQVVATGGVADGVVQGDLVLVGGCDPTLDSDDLNTLAQAVKAAGIREVKGDFLVYEAGLPRMAEIDPAQPDHVGYNPAVSGIALNFNRVHFEWRRGGSGYDVTMDARTKMLRPEVSMARMQVADRGTPVYTYQGSDARDEWTVAKGALGGGGARWLPVRIPGLYAGDVFRTLLRAQGIVVPAAHLTEQRPTGDVLGRHHSEPLQVIVRGMLKYSNNLTAEMLGLSATAKRAGRVMGLRESAAEMSQWAAEALGMEGTHLVDHSGLGDGSRMTARGVAWAMAQMPDLRALLNKIKQRDGKGRPIPDHPVQAQAKTGTLNFVSGLAGFVTGAEGREMTFAIFAADLPRRGAIPKAEREAPRGARSWNARAKRMQRALLAHWGAFHAG